MAVRSRHTQRARDARGSATIRPVWVISAKHESTRDRRMTQLIESCAAGELVPNQRYGDVPRWVQRAAAAAEAAR